MIKKLQLKLISVSMISLLIVLFVIEGTIGIMNYRKIVNDAEQILEVLSEHAGKFPEDFPSKKGRDRPEMSPEIPFESRYFSVLLDEEGNEISVDIGKVAAIGREEAVTYAARVWNGQKEKGFMGNYRYMKSQSETGIRITFLDCRRLAGYVPESGYECVGDFSGWFGSCTAFNFLFIVPYYETFF